MRRLVALVVVTAAAVGWIGSANGGQDATSSRNATQRRLEANVRFLADDLLEGRATPSRGLDMAALYLENELREAGWHPGSGASYFQPYEVDTFAPLEAKRVVRINGVELMPGEYNFSTSGSPSDAVGSFDLVYAGYGIVSPERRHDDLAGLDLKGKGVVTLFGAPWALDPSGIHDSDRAVGRGIQLGIRGANVLIYVSPEFDSPREAPASPEVALWRDSEAMPVSFLPGVSGRTVMPFVPASIVLRPAAFDRVLASTCGGTFDELSKALASGTPTEPRPIAATVAIEMQPKVAVGKVANVVATLPGSDPLLRKEWIVLSAHYDHVGTIEAPPGSDRICNGADDNASGVAAVLEIARRLAAGPTPKRSVLVLLLSGEEKGLLGSGYYSLHPLVPTAQVVANINLDMVGRSDGTVEVIAAVSSDLFRAASESSGASGIQVVADRHPEKHLLYFVDSYHFARLDVPAAELFTAMHADYHQPSDEAGKMRYDRLAAIVDVACRLVGHYAEGASRPRYQRPAWFMAP